MKTSTGQNNTLPPKITLPIGIQNFAKLVSKDCIYVDKTKYIYNLLQGGRIYFLSRPRRFGKSLLISTLKEIFNGNKELFKGYWIYNHLETWEKYPVIHLDFLGIDYENLGVEEALITRFDEIASQYDIQLTGKSFKLRFGDLIKKLAEKENKRVVILVDEYDKPIFDYVENDNMTTSEINRKKLINLYSVIKNQEENIEFLFITGVSRFTKVSIFTDINNLFDITIHGDYANILGYTRKELEENFQFYIDKWSREERRNRKELLDNLKKEYDGYSWDGKNFVYNPDSIHKALKESSFGSHWFATGTPTFLVKKLIEKGIDIANFENLRVKKDFFNEYDVTDINLLLFQTGYLTIKAADDTGFALYYPNKEVESSFLHLLFKKYSRKEQSQIEEITSKIKNALSEGNVNFFIDIIRTLLADILYDISLSKYEAFYHSIIFIALKLAKFDVRVERETDLGRIDMLVQSDRYIYILEFKMDDAGKALTQILKKKYYEPFLSEEKKIFLVGIGFSREHRNIARVNYALLPAESTGERGTLSLSLDNMDIFTLNYPSEPSNPSTIGQ